MAPTKYEVSVRFGKFWKVVYTNVVDKSEGAQEEEQKSNTEQTIELNCMTYSGIKIYMIDGDGRIDDGGEKKIAYGI